MQDFEIITRRMIEYYKDDPKRVNHFMKVYFYAKFISISEKLDKKTQRTIEIASLVHDIGIRNSETKYNSNSGKYQEIEGPPEAEKLLKNCNIEKDIINRVCYLVGHHHTYKNIKDIDYQILVEADFLVNIFEENLNKKNIETIKSSIFVTHTGIELLNILFL